MPSERIQQEVDRLLDSISEAVARRDWEAVRDLAMDVLAFDPNNADADAFLVAANRRLGDSSAPL